MKVFKKILKILAIVLAVVLALLIAYCAYMLISYHRIGDQTLAPEGNADGAIERGDELRIISYNIGFGAYEEDFGFFMDGGDRAWAWSEERLDANLKKIADVLRQENAELYLVQEVDIGSTRSYQFDERPYLSDVLTGYSNVFAQNYDSAFLCLPITQPFGVAKSGLMTFSQAPIASSERIGIPVETGLTKFLDLDRCYSKSRIPLSDGGELVL